MSIIERQGGHSGGGDEGSPMAPGQRSVLMFVGIISAVVTLHVGGIGGDGAGGRKEWNRSKSNDGGGTRLHLCTYDIGLPQN